MSHPVTSVAPGKVFLSGEHAVVYGAPALAVAVDRHVRVRAERVANNVMFHLSDFAQHWQLSWQQLQLEHQQVEQRYQQFLAGNLAVNQVIRQPRDLLSYALGELVDSQTPATGAKFYLSTNIPVGAGMSSSAAVIASLLYGAGQVLNRPLSLEKLVQLTRQAENLQHGRSSGLDPAVVCHGGCVDWQQGAITSITAELNGWYMLNTGRPESSTGECVQQVRQQFAESPIWQDFSETTLSMREALVNNNQPRLQQLVRVNHQLLCQLGVVPEKVQQQVAALEQQGLSAKISGAGSIAGDQAGIMLIYAPQADHELIERLGLSPLRIDHQGVRLVDNA